MSINLAEMDSAHEKHRSKLKDLTDYQLFCELIERQETHFNHHYTNNGLNAFILAESRDLSGDHVWCMAKFVPKTGKLNGFYLE